MFRTFVICLLFFCLVSKAVGFLTFQTSGNIDGRRQTQGSAEPYMFRNAFNTGRMLAQVGNQGLRELSDLAGVPMGGDFVSHSYGSAKTPSFGFNTGSGFGQPPKAVDSAMVNNAVASSKMLVQLGKQELRELSDLAGVQIGGDLLFRDSETYKNPSFSLNPGSNPSPNTPTSPTLENTFKPLSLISDKYPVQVPQPLAIPAALASLAISHDTGANSEMVYQPESFQVPQSLEIAETPQIQQFPSQIHPPPYKGTYNPLAEDDFHLSFSILNPSKSSSKTQDPPIMYPIQFYSPQALQMASLPEKRESKSSDYHSNYDNFDAW